jgi:hypothetical protein
MVSAAFCVDCAPSSKGSSTLSHNWAAPANLNRTKNASPLDRGRWIFPYVPRASSFRVQTGVSPSMPPPDEDRGGESSSLGLLGDTLACNMAAIHTDMRLV